MSVKISIPVDSTIADVVEGLRDPIEYVRRVLETLVDYGAKRGSEDYLVLLSLQSDPSVPDYAIFEIFDDETRGGSIMTVRSGRTHKEIDYEKSCSILWAHDGSTFNEVQDVIGKLRAAAKG